MKLVIIIIALFGLASCNDRTDKNIVDENLKTVHSDSLYIDSNNVSGAGGQPYREINNCNFDNVAADRKTPKLAKDIYLDNDWDLDNDIEALALLDSLTAKNKSSRPFYFKVVTKSYKKADGYFSEGLGLIGKEYIEKSTNEFATYFDNKDCFTDTDLATWADIVLFEFRISGEGEYCMPLIDNYIKKLKSNCKDCSASQKETIDKFGLTLKSKWEEFFNRQ